jgi:hypothetical protein
MENPPKEVTSFEAAIYRTKEIFQVSGQRGQSLAVLAVKHMPFLCLAGYFDV